MPTVTIEEIYLHPDIIRACKTIGGQEWEDIRGEVIAKYMELPEARRAQIKDLVGFMVRMCRNYGLDMLKKKKPELWHSFDDIEEHLPKEPRIADKILSDCNNKVYFYHARIFLRSNQLGSVKAFSRTTKIPYSELTRAYKDYKTYLINWLKSHD